jgi:short subunit dehydrogenase-like uncharacterized protein
MKNEILLYGATGYTGKLIIEALLARKIKPILAGRNANALRILGEKYSLPTAVFDLSELEKIKNALTNCKAVIHAAGPFIHTYQNMLQACIATQTNYLDITGEYQVFEGCAAKNKEATNANIMVMPGVGFDVVPSDCLANALKAKMPDAQNLSLAFAALKGGFSRGTAKTMVENLGDGGMIRSNNKLLPVKAAFDVKEIDFGAFKSTAVTIAWGDISTAFFSTKIPNIKVYMAAPPALIKQMKRSNYLSWFFKLSFVKSFLKKQIDKRKPGPDERQREEGRSFFWGCVENTKGEKIEMRLQTPEGYKLTALTTALIAQKVLNNELVVGYQTPASAYGKDLILEIDNCKFF